MLYTGQIQAKMDAKGRLFFPAEFRKQNSDGDGRYVLKRDLYEDCIVIYPFASWEKEVEVLRRNLNRWNPGEAALYRQFLSEAEVLALDANGRFVVPRRLLPLLGGERTVTFIGMYDRIELWSASRTAEPFISPEEFAEAISKVMAKKEEIIQEQ